MNVIQIQVTNRNANAWNSRSSYKAVVTISAAIHTRGQRGRTYVFPHPRDYFKKLYITEMFEEEETKIVYSSPFHSTTFVDLRLVVDFSCRKLPIYITTNCINFAKLE